MSALVVNAVSRCICVMIAPTSGAERLVAGRLRVGGRDASERRPAAARLAGLDAGVAARLAVDVDAVTASSRALEALGRREFVRLAGVEGAHRAPPCSSS